MGKRYQSHSQQSEDNRELSSFPPATANPLFQALDIVLLEEDAAQALVLLSPTPAMNHFAPAAMLHGSDNSEAMDEISGDSSAMPQASGDERQLYHSATREEAAWGLALLSSPTPANSEAMDIDSGSDSDVPLSSSSSSYSKLPCTFPGCETRLSNKKTLRQHLSSIHNETRIRVECIDPNCHQYFSTKTNMSQHYNEQHGSGGSRYTCPVQNCDRRFSRRFNMNEHIKSQHPPEDSSSPSLKCPVCPSRLSCRSNLRRHLKDVHKMQPQS